MAKPKTFNELSQNRPSMQDNLLTIVDNRTQLEQSETFQQIVQRISELIPQAKKNATIDVRELDDKEMTELNKKFTDTQKYVKQINDSRKMVKNYFNWKRDLYLAGIDQLLDQAGFNELDKYYKINKQQKRDKIAWRINERWNQLKVTFDKNLQIYPLIAQMAPQLADFNHYRLTHDNMVSGAVSKKVNDKMRSEINNELNQWNSNLQTIQDNHDNLEPKFQQRLLEQFIVNPTSDNLTNSLRILKDAQHAEHQAQQAAKQTINRRNKVTSTITQPTVVVQKTEPDKFDPSWLVQYCFSHPKYKKIHDNNKIKATLLQEMFSQLTQSDSIWNRHIGTDSDKIVETTRYITNM